MPAPANALVPGSGAPLVKHRHADVLPRTDHRHRRIPLGLPENPDDLFFAELAPFHSPAAFPFRSGTPPLSRPSFGGQVIGLSILSHIGGGTVCN